MARGLDECDPAGSITVVVNGLVNGRGRASQLDEQIDALLDQTIKPAEILVCNDAMYSDASRFSFALKAQAEFVAMFDDGIIPGKRWLENCLATMNERDALLGAIGLRYLEPPFAQSPDVSYYNRSVIIGSWPGGRRDEAVEVDIVGHALFFKRIWLSTFWRELPDSTFPPHGEGMHFSAMLQKYLDIPTVVPRHPPGQPELHGIASPSQVGAPPFGENVPGGPPTPSPDSVNARFVAQRRAGWHLVNDAPRSPPAVFYLAQRAFEAGDFDGARRWYAQRAEMGGGDEAVYLSLYRVAESMAALDRPWPEVQEAYLRAWEFRPTRAEPLYVIARHYRISMRFQFGYLFAQRAAQIPLPEQDTLLVVADVYAWRAIDELAICASRIGEHVSAFGLCRRLLALPDIPAADRQRAAGNRDFSVPTMLEAAGRYPAAEVKRALTNSGEAGIVVSLVAGPDRETTEQTLNSFLNCCTDVSRVGRFLALDAGLSVADRAELSERYGFLEFVGTYTGESTIALLAPLHPGVRARFWLHLGQGWKFFAPENYITRLTAVLESEPQVVQVGINFTDAATLTGACAGEAEVRRASDAGRYVLTDRIARGPAMFDIDRLPRDGSADSTNPVHTATLDEVLCTATN